MGKISNAVGKIVIAGGLILYGMYLASHPSCISKMKEKGKDLIGKINAEYKVTDNYRSNDIGKNVIKIMNESPAYKSNTIRFEYNNNFRG